MQMKSLENGYIPMRNVLKEKVVGKARIEHYIISEEEAKFAQLRSHEN